MDEPRSWQQDAACKGRTDLSWFPVAREGRGGQTREYRAAVAAAIAVCHECPVIAECRQAGATEQGIWAGVLHDAHAPRVREVQPCGTPAAYSRHRRMGEEPCQACRTAFTISRQERRDATTAAAATRVRVMLRRTG